ncbi:unnamed protein product [Mycena citricolor]|uniref:Major facilitator superfamily (MFS) profile domain-containing protein n=1 Tax=Mycena citricolor TaxID=2018698 RepID=A0AAD2JWZ9_9AGAR|nr:unnamed protein product [Mycena citricolor]
MSSRPSSESPSHTVAPSNELHGSSEEKNPGATGASEDTTEKAGEAEVHYVHGVELALITLALMLAVLLVALDNTIIATAIPKITDQFDSLADVGWYGSAYLVATAATQLQFGKFYSILPIKWVFISAIAVFEIGSAVCGSAPSSGALIGGRAIAGLGSSGIFSGAFIIVAHIVPLAKRPIFNGLFGAIYGVSSVVGPLLGGAFTDKVSWRWCFYINLPIGGVCLLFLVFFFRMPESIQARSAANASEVSAWERFKQFDPLGIVTFMPAIVCLLLALQWGGSKYAWSDGRIIALFVVFGVLIFAFVGIQIWGQDGATVPPRIIRQRTVSCSAFFAFCQGSSFFLFVYYLAIWFQAIKGTTAIKSGIDTIPLVFGTVIGNVLCGFGTSMTGYFAPFMFVCTILMSVGAGLMTTFTTTTGHAHWLGYQVILGLGVGFGMQQGITAVQAILPAKDVSVGTAIVIFTQNLGGALFVSVGQNLFQNKLLAGIARNVPQVDPLSVLSAGATSLKSVVPAQYFGAVIVEYNAALMAAFQVGLIMAALSLLGAAGVEWVSIKKSPAERSESA